MQEPIHTEETNEVASDVEDNMDDDIPVILLSKAEKEQINAPWRSALIIKVFGKSIGFKYMDFKIRSLWKPLGDMQCIDLGNDFFLIRFTLEEDYWKVVNGGPWFINQQFLTIRRWSPGFRPSEAKISTTAVWACLPELPIELYDTNILRRIGNQLGSLLKVDARTMDNERGRFARLCVQIDLEQPLIPKVRIGNMIQKIQYEGISAICFECGRVGHRLDTCPSKIAHACPASPRTPEPIHPPNSKQDSSNYGKWMLVSRRKSATKKAVQKNANTVPKALASSHASTHRNLKFTNSTPRDSPIEPHKDPMSSSSIPINRDQGNPPKSNQSVTPNQPPSTHNTQIFTHHSDIINAAHFEKPNTTLPSPTDNTLLDDKSLSSHNSASGHHVTYPSDHTSSHSSKINSHLPTVKVPDFLPLPNPRTSMDIDTTKVSLSSEIHSNPHTLTASGLRTLVTHGSTSSSLPPEPSQHTKQSLSPK